MTTFILYLILLCIFQIGVSSGNGISDAAALEIARLHHSSFAVIYLVKSIFQAIAPTFGGLLVRTPETKVYLKHLKM